MSEERDLAHPDDTPPSSRPSAKATNESSEGLRTLLAVILILALMFCVFALGVLFILSPLLLLYYILHWPYWLSFLVGLPIGLFLAAKWVFYIEEKEVIKARIKKNSGEK